MNMYLRVIALVSTSAMLQGCLTHRSAEPPAVTPAGEITATAPVPQPAREPASAPAPAPVPVPAPPAPAREPALNLVAATTKPSAGELLITGLNVEQSTIEILASGPIRDYSLITLSDPSRLVIDIPNAVSGFKQNSIPIDKCGIALLRFESHPDFLRIYLDATQWRIIPYRLEESDTGLKIIITTP